MEHSDARKLPEPLQQNLRKQCVKAVLSGRSQSAVARQYGVSRRSVNKWIQFYKSGGDRALKGKRKGRPKGIKLESWQVAQTVKAIYNSCPDHHGMPFFLWTREAVKTFIRMRFGITLSRWTVGRYLKNWGLSPQKPVRRAFEQNQKRVEQWLSKDYPKILNRAKREGGVIFWGDEMGIRSDDNKGRTYGKRGKTPLISKTGQRFGCNMISAITNLGHLNFMIFRNNFKIDVFIRFLQRLTQQSKRKVFLIIDQHPVHKAKKVQEWLKKQEKRIEIFFLPGYCPELNPDELLNQDVKLNAVGRKRPHNQGEMIEQVRSYLHMRQKQPEVIQRFFDEKHVRYAAMQGENYLCSP